MDLSNPIDREALALFIELESTPWRERKTKAFDERAHQLARLLGLIPEWWRTCSVLDRSKRPPWPSHLCAFHDWHRVKRVREVLLAEAKKLQQQQAAE
jgi:hypothetical protein